MTKEKVKCWRCEHLHPEGAMTEDFGIDHDVVIEVCPKCLQKGHDLDAIVERLKLSQKNIHEAKIT